jgi:hypothetical protein
VREWAGKEVLSARGRELIDLLEELEYPVDRRVKTYRLFWGDEA